MIKRNYPARCENNLLGVRLVDEEKPCALLTSDAERWRPREVQPGLARGRRAPGAMAVSLPLTENAAPCCREFVIPERKAGVCHPVHTPEACPDGEMGREGGKAKGKKPLGDGR